MRHARRRCAYAQGRRLFAARHDVQDAIGIERERAAAERDERLPHRIDRAAVHFEGGRLLLRVHRRINEIGFVQLHDFML